MARPTIITPEVQEALCDAILEGVSVKEFCRRPEAPNESTIYKAFLRDEEFVKLYARAKEVSAYRMDEEILEIADDSRNDWMARKQASGGGRSDIDGEMEQELVPNHEHVNRSRLRVDSRKWLMSKLAPKKYGDRLEVDQKTLHSADSTIVGLMQRIAENGRRIQDRGSVDQRLIEQHPNSLGSRGALPAGEQVELGEHVGLEPDAD